jgi:hypothetical protein
MRKQFETPEIDVVKFGAEDVNLLTDSNWGDVDVDPWKFDNLGQ